MITFGWNFETILFRLEIMTKIRATFISSLVVLC